jgi:palmitoyltransferase
LLYSPSRLVGYIFKKRHQRGLAIAFLTLYFLFFFLSLTTYFRTYYAAHFKPALVPLSDKRRGFEKARKQRKGDPKHGASDDVEEAQPDWMPVDMDPDSPGLEKFYSKQIFVCEKDGRPRWCSLCWNWKPDRASHSAELGRCVRRMDHLCPWVGGMISESCK